MSSNRPRGALTRRDALRLIGGAGMAAGAGSLGLSPRSAHATAAGMPQPDEKVADTLKRLFGDRPLKPAGDAIKFEAPMIAENGAVVPIRVDVDLPMSGDEYVKNIYIISDKNRRPLNTKVSLTPESGRATMGTNIRLASTTDVRAIAETSKGALYEAKREVKVTVGGCGG
ncbi:MAG TPA: thiosulfate oxidation carrier protein SoxY [Burkholderiaceae bacterium]|nr:thiosulfate oxidation carrier protein SoxY [Burkholderiaceae bacterium]